jgi:hypothetical protein
MLCRDNQTGPPITASDREDINTSTPKDDMAISKIEPEEIGVRGCV